MLTACAADVDTVEVSTSAVVGAAFADTADATGYRIEQYVGQEMRVDPLGIDSFIPMDLARPQSVVESAGGLWHTTIDLGVVLEAMAPGDLDLKLEMWADGSRLVVDTSGIEVLAGSGAELGPLEPGIAFVDLTAGPDAGALVTALLGVGAADLAELGTALPAALSGLRQVQDQPPVFEGTASFAEVVEAMGTDLEVMARSIAAGMALNLPIDVDEIADFYVGFYRRTQADVRVELDQDGRVSAVEIHTDLSGIYTDMFEPDADLDLDLDASELEFASSMFEGSVLIIENRMEFEFDDDLVVEPPPPTDDDRTQEWLDFLVNAGLLDG